MEPREDAVADSKLIQEIMFPDLTSETPMSLAEWDKEATIRELGADYADACQEWKDAGGLYSGYTAELSNDDQAILDSGWAFEKKWRHDPSNFTEEEKAAWKKFFDGDLARMKVLLKELGMLADESTADESLADLPAGLEADLSCVKKAELRSRVDIILESLEQSVPADLLEDYVSVLVCLAPGMETSRFVEMCVLLVSTFHLAASSTKR